MKNRDVGEYIYNGKMEIIEFAKNIEYIMCESLQSRIY